MSCDSGTLMVMTLIGAAMKVILIVVALELVCSKSNNISLQADNSEVGLLKVMVHHIDMRVKKLELASGSKPKRKVWVSQRGLCH